MYYKISFSFCAFFLILSISLFSQNVQKEIEQNLLIEHLDATQQIVVYAPYAIEKYEDGKLYLDENHIYETNLGSLLNLTNGKTLVLPPRVQGFNGHYLIGSSVHAKKLFKNVCNDCHYEWEGGVFTSQCPQCGSTNFSTVPNW